MFFEKHSSQNDTQIGETKWIINKDEAQQVGEEFQGVKTINPLFIDDRLEVQ